MRGRARATLSVACRLPRVRTAETRITLAAVPTWKEIEQAEPEFAGRVRQLFDAGRHKTIATLRADGSPRISGIECEFADGDLRFGSMTDARKGADLKRDPRFAIHGPTFHPEEGKESEWPGEAKIAGRAILVWRDRHRRRERATRRGDVLRGDHRSRRHGTRRRGHQARHRVMDARARAAKSRAGLAVDIWFSWRERVLWTRCRQGIQSVWSPRTRATAWR